MSEQTEIRIQSLLREIPVIGLPAVQRLFCTELGYAYANEPLPSGHWPDQAQRLIADRPVLLARHPSEAGSFDVIYVCLRSSPEICGRPLSYLAERWAIMELLKDRRHALFVFSDPGARHWHLVNVPNRADVKQSLVLRRITIDPHQRLQMAAQRVALLSLLPPTLSNGQAPPQAVQERHDQAFDPQPVADGFLQGYRRLFWDLKAVLQASIDDVGQVHAHALRFVSQLLFLFFLERSRLFENDASFLTKFWDAYGRSGSPEDTFVGEWLEEALFGALCGADRSTCDCWWSLPPPIRNVLEAAPQFRGGLFDPYRDSHARDEVRRSSIPDAHFERILGFMQGYDLAICEDTPTDQEVAVGPAMLGRLYESLVGDGEDGEARASTGIYYTPLVEVDLMCRLALVDWLSNHLGPAWHSLLNRAVFASDPQAVEEADAALAQAGVWQAIRDLLGSLAVVDPACGSGAFLLGMFQVLDGFMSRANLHTGVQETSPARKRRIISNSLYGMDVKQQAVQIARSRLYLKCLVDGSPSITESGRDWLLPELLQTVRSEDSLLSQTKTVAYSQDTASSRPRCFDIVIGNPPYVRQELIRDPSNLSGGGQGVDESEYKDHLARAVYAAWPRAFGHDAARGKVRKRLDARSDLYVYFFLLGLSRLHPQGTLCFVTSNSWLDARYGRILQDFLLARGQIKLVIDNRASRSFSGANVNTVIVLLGAANDTPAPRVESLKSLARFVSLELPFDHVNSSATWERVANTTEYFSDPELRVLAIRQDQLLSSATSARSGRLEGDKWGAKYLRSPEIYWLIQEKYADRLVQLGAIATVRRGITTGANRFFFVDEKSSTAWGIESEFLYPALKSPRQCDSLWLDLGRCGALRLFVCPRERAELQGTGALSYIEYGESQRIHERPTCRHRSPWWDLGSRSGARIHCNYMVDEVLRFYASNRPCFASDSFQEIHVEAGLEAVLAACNSTLCQLSANVLGRSNFGGGLLKLQTYEVRGLLIPDPRALGDAVNGRIQNAGLLGLKGRERRALDDVIFDVLGLSQGERDAVYEAVMGMVAARQAKARSLTAS